MDLATKTVYVIEYKRHGFEKTCFKIGITIDIKKRRRQHENHNLGLKGWIKTISVRTTKVPVDDASAVEVLWTNQYIAAYGMLRVRGAHYDSGNMSKNGINTQYNSLHNCFKGWASKAFTETAATFDRCYKCHGCHQARRCPQTLAKSVYMDRFLSEGVPGITSPKLVLTVDAGVVVYPNRRLSGKERLRWLLHWSMNENTCSNITRKTTNSRVSAVYKKL